MVSRRIEKVNKQIQRIMGEIFQTKAELPRDVLVTIAVVDTTANLQAATVWLSVYPEDETEAVLEKLKEQMYDLQGYFNRAVSLKPLPRLKLAAHVGR